MKLYHRTSSDAAGTILAKGFIDGEGQYGTDRIFRGVWLTLIAPLDPAGGITTGDAVLEVALDLDEAEFAYYEWVEESKSYRELLMPASIVNARGQVRLLTDDEEARLGYCDGPARYGSPDLGELWRGEGR